MFYKYFLLRTEIELYVNVESPTLQSFILRQLDKILKNSFD